MITALVATVLIQTAPIQADRTALIAVDPPAQRAHHALVYDAARSRVLLTGGSTPRDDGRRFEFFDDLWSFDGDQWRALPSSGMQRSGQKLAYDSKRSAVWSFGGFTGNDSRNDLLRLVDDRWQTIDSIPDHPVAEGGLVYDAARDRLIAFGGSPAMNQLHGDTWEYDFDDWRRVTTEGPPARQAFVMVYDAQRSRTIVFGGMGIPPARFLADTWSYDGQRWTELQVAGPSPRISAGHAYDSKRGRLILFGGSNANGFLGDTWAFDGTSWRQLASTGPAPRAMGHMTYDAQRDRVVLFGGRRGYPNGDMSDTWEWDGTSWHQVMVRREVRRGVEDDVTVVADLYQRARPADAATILLFHQGGGDARGEYEPIIPRLLDEGFDVLAVDVRGGGSRFGGMHRTPQTPDFRYCEAAADVAAAIDLAREQGISGKLILWGSSYTGTLVIEAAARRAADVQAVLAFSPARGDPMRECEAPAHVTALRSHQIPLHVFSSSAELGNPGARERFELLQRLGAITFEARGAGHGSSILVHDRFEGDTSPQWTAVLEALRSGRP